MNFKNKYDRYKLSDWLTLIIGLIICSIQVYQYAFDKLGDPIIEIVVACIWLLLIIAPKSINDIVRKNRGLDDN